MKGVFTGFPRNLHNQRNDIALLNIEGVQCKEDTTFYLGKRVAFVYKAQKEKKGSKYR